MTNVRNKGVACSIDDCSRPAFCKALCKLHYDRKSRLGDALAPVLAMQRRGETAAWIAEHATFTGNECLIWPFRRHPDGRAGRTSKGWAARIMCEAAHGPAPTPDHQAAHACGKGHEACVNPTHLSWKTPVENMADTLAHGTRIQGSKHRGAKLTEEAVRSIRLLAGTMLQREIAERFGVKLVCVNKVLNGITWRHVA